MNTCGVSRRGLGLPTFRQFQRELDQLFDGAVPLAVRVDSEMRGKISAPLSLWEEGDNLFLELEIPGLKQEEVEITIDKQVLRISAERKAPEQERKYWHQERAFGRIERLITLPDTVQADAVEAELKNGVLLVRLPKRPEVQPKKIVIRGDVVDSAAPNSSSD